MGIHKNIYHINSTSFFAKLSAIARLKIGRVACQYLMFICYAMASLYKAASFAETTAAETTLTLGDFWQDPWQCQPPNGESMESFMERVDNFWQNLLSQLCQSELEKADSLNTLVLSHGGVIRYLLAKVLGLPIPGTYHMTNLDVPYGSLIHLQVFIDNEGKAWSKLML